MTQNAFLQICKACNHEFRAHAKLVGKSVPCPYCQKPLTVVAVVGQPNDKLVGQEVGGCRLAKRLGAGALGVVYEAKQLSIGRRVAIKMLSSKAASDKEVVARFQREANLCAKIKHPNVVGVYDCGLDRGVHFLTMDFIDGLTLAALIEEQGKLEWKEAAGYITQIARALEHVHGQGIIHRDIKPANILIDEQKVAKLADLGLAKQVDNEEGSGAGLTMQGIAMGSPAYMPPEQIRNAKEATHLADVYALGATFYQTVTGVIPFDGKNGTEVMTKVLREEAAPAITRVPTLPQGVSDLIQSMLSKNPADRPQGAAVLIQELEAVVADPVKPRSRKRVVKRVAVERLGQRGTAVIIIAVILVVALIIVLI
nr:serine/threonine protein kinase [Planctomycetota bacterium]